MSIKMTSNRKVLLAELKKMCSHPTAEELYAHIKNTSEQISLATVYRNLEAMVRDGIINVIETNAGPRRYDGNTEFHEHISCSVCGKLGDVFCKSSECCHKKPRVKGFKVTGHRVDFFGICDECGGAR